MVRRIFESNNSGIEVIEPLENYYGGVDWDDVEYIGVYVLKYRPEDLEDFLNGNIGEDDIDWDEDVESYIVDNDVELEGAQNAAIEYANNYAKQYGAPAEIVLIGYNYDGEAMDFDYHDTIYKVIPKN